MTKPKKGIYAREIHLLSPHTVSTRNLLHRHKSIDNSYPIIICNNESKIDVGKAKYVLERDRSISQYLSMQNTLSYIIDIRSFVLIILLTFYIKIYRALGRSQFIGGLAGVCAGILSINCQNVQRCEAKVTSCSVSVTSGQWFTIVEPLHLHIRIRIGFYAAFVMCTLSFD